jgi:hypothetical protein
MPLKHPAMESGRGKAAKLQHKKPRSEDRGFELCF